MRKNVTALLLFFVIGAFLSGCESRQNNDNLITLENIPVFSDAPYVELYNNIPCFNDEDYVTDSYEYYSELDELGRGGAAIACIGLDIMPTTERESIGTITPSGWHLAKYDCVDGKYLYNRCHLIGYQLGGENANVKNLITGTRYMNVKGMLPFENMVADYVKATDNHVLYRVTPIYEGDNLLANGVQIEGYSVEDSGAGISFNVFVYNAQPQIVIDYANGESVFVGFDNDTKEGDGLIDETVGDGGEDKEKEIAEQTTEEAIIAVPGIGGSTTNAGIIADDGADSEIDVGEEVTHSYVLNTNTRKFHYPTCPSVDEIKEKNKDNYSGTREELLNRGFSPCGRCNP